MSAKLLFDEVVQDLKNAKSNMRCKELAGHLTRLGFDVRDGNRGGHKLYFHDGVQGFTSGGYNCGHGKNPEIKPAYIRKVVRVLELYESEILKFLEGEER
jgi:hypothetical protein